MAKGDDGEMTRDEFLTIARDALDDMEHETSEDETSEDWLEVFLGYVVATAAKHGFVLEADDDDGEE